MTEDDAERDRLIRLCEELLTPPGGKPIGKSEETLSGLWTPYAVPTAKRIIKLEDRLERIEQRLARLSSAETELTIPPTVHSESPGLCADDIVKIANALRPRRDHD